MGFLPASQLWEFQTPKSLQVAEADPDGIANPDNGVLPRLYVRG